MDINWGELAFQVAIVIAIVNWIKALSKNKLGSYSVLISMGVAFIVVFLATMPNPIVWFELVKSATVTGLSASGFYVIAGKIGNK